MLSHFNHLPTPPSRNTDFCQHLNFGNYRFCEVKTQKCSKMSPVPPRTPTSPPSSSSGVLSAISSPFRSLASLLNRTPTNSPKTPKTTVRTGKCAVFNHLTFYFSSAVNCWGLWDITYSQFGTGGRERCFPDCISPFLTWLHIVSFMKDCH